MHARRTLLTSAAAALALLFAPSFVQSLAGPAVAQSGKPIPVVATFSILGDMVKRIGGRHVAVTTLVGPDGDTHVYRPTPADARAVSEARILVVNGLQFEGWLDRLIDASDFRGVRVVATDGIEPIAFEEDGHDGHVEHAGHAGHGHGHHGHDHGAFDPHAWQSVRNATVYAHNIAAALARAAPAKAAAFSRNRAAYLDELEALDADIDRIVARLPAGRRTVVTSHDAFQYFGRRYGLTFIAPQGLSTESEASAKGVARLVRQIRAEGIRAVFVENITDPRLLTRIAEETGARIGGTLYPGALSGPDGPAPTYLDMMRHNATTIAKALAP
ncbi:MAG: metal ABC transporter substrate-binding protein [Rhodospirillaceae bacterium]|nr:metal ABC transporter substrate-binding protein [Rhodospirillaceae bacterium]